MNAWILRLPEGDQEQMIEEINRGRLRQGWGLPGMELKCGEVIRERPEWVYKNLSNEDIIEKWGRDCRGKLRYIYDSLKQMMEIEAGDLLFIPNFENKNKFALVRARSDEDGVYHHDEGLTAGENSCDFIHYITIDAESLSTFSYDDLSVPNALQKFVRRELQRDEIIRPVNDREIIYMLKSCRSKNKKCEMGGINPQEAELQGKVGDLLEDFKDWLQTLSRVQLETVVENLLMSDGFVIEDREVYDGHCGDIDIIASRPLNVLGRSERFEVLVQIDSGYCNEFSGSKERIDCFISQAEALNKEQSRLIHVDLSTEEDCLTVSRQEASRRGIIVIRGKELARMYLENMI